jgi:tetratricopeptide (TPR) repeat protein
MLSRMFAARAHVLTVIGLCAISSIAAGTQGAPELPTLAIDRFPLAAREAVSRAYTDAQAHPRDAAAVGAFGRVLHAWEQWESAHQAYGRAQALAPRAFAWSYLDAVVLQRLARHAEAVTRLEQALAISSAYLPARVRLAEARLEIGDLERSRREFELLVREPGAEPAAHMGLGRIAAMERRHADAIKEFEQAVALFPELGAAYYALARSQRVLGQTAEAGKSLEQHARHGAKWPAIDDPVLTAVTSLRDDARALLRRGVALSDSGDLTGAISAHEAALAADASLTQAHANLINLYGRAREWTKADQHYRAALAAGLDLGDVHYDYGVILGLQEKWMPAETAYRRAIQANPLHTQARNNLGQLLERKREFESAAAEYQRALEARPAFRLARFNLGRMLLALDRPDEAIAEFEKLREPRDAEAPRYLFGLATAHVRAGHREEGIKWAIDARKLALAHGQQDLADAIERELVKLK